MASNEITMRRTTKTIAASLLLAYATLTVGAQESENNGTWGGLCIGYGTRIESPGVGVMIQTWLVNWARLEIGGDYFFGGKKKDLMDRDHNVTLYDINTNIHFVVPLQGKVNPYALLGGGVVFCSGKGISSETNIGSNVGAGIDLRVSPKTRVNIEWHHQFVKDYGQSVFTLGAVFKF